MALVLAIFYWFGTILSVKLWHPFASVPTPSGSAFLPYISVYCKVFPGPFCNFSSTQTSVSDDELARVAQTVSVTTKKASNVFESVTHLSNPNSLGIYQSEIWELTYAILYSSKFDDKEVLAAELWQLGEVTGQLKDQIIDLNGQAITAFSSIVHEFGRVGQVVEWVYSGRKTYSLELIEKNLDIAFSNFDWELKRLITTIETTIPIASRATSLGLKISERIHKEHYKLESIKDSQSFWKKLTDETTKTGKQLRRDLRLTSKSIKTARVLRLGLEEGAILGWHMADHGLSAEDELVTMRETIENLQETIFSVKFHLREPPQSSDIA
ncbi:uncharacterized protein PGTG_09787 [Puccinia graminis f. sp. tritici CRL 75-36-700-3]|uniref:Uncharacterized protein n=1 Tax=Puccinia graminis f. sp. tritici (strain CRL 75-36-700-3 / race SCCL) TaxID=418459 RepID=E3KEU4_PUCGT|nr:uncharacterized protein PGTG_09787 [Puccinia graminis f. sp. tritici CRL 75-36-700-3]EFP82819.2 hypothetical protein PGTG_09787 [Puccinia graminis f. sp. tritici CRL 75-36-700-3]